MGWSFQGPGQRRCLGTESMPECLLSEDLHVSRGFKSLPWSFSLFSSVLLLTLPNPCCRLLLCFFFWKQEHFGKGQSKDFQLFDSPLEKDLLFKNSAIGLLKIPSRMDYRLYLGHNYVTAIRNVREGQCKYSGKARCRQGMWGSRQGQEAAIVFLGTVSLS